MSDIATLERPATAPRPPTPRVPDLLRPAYERQERRLLAHPFMRRCETGAVTMTELSRYLVQHGHYGRCFTRYLCALISQLPDNEQVIRLAGNLAEELGLAGGQGIPHARLYADMLRQFNLSLEREPANPQTRALVETMFMLCRQPGGAAGLGALCLGAEAIVPALYRRVMEGFAHHGITGPRLIFFQLHVDCDDDHAQTMYDILADWCERSETAREAATAAAETAVSARLRMFDSVLDAPIPQGA